MAVDGNDAVCKKSSHETLSLPPRFPRVSALGNQTRAIATHTECYNTWRAHNIRDILPALSHTQACLPTDDPHLDTPTLT